MRRTVPWVAVVLLSVAIIPLLEAGVDRREVGNLVLEDIPEIPSRIVERMFQYQSTRSAFFEDWEPTNGGMLISTRFGETSQLHLVATPGGAREQITFFPEPVASATVCPDPGRKGFLFTKDVGGGEAYQIYYFDLKTGGYELLTDGTSRNGSPRWTNRGDRFVFFTTKRNGTDWDLHLTAMETPRESKPVLTEGGYWVPVDWSPDDTKLLVLHYVSANETYYHILDLDSGSLTQLNPSKNKIAYGSALWARDGQGIFITSDEGSQFQTLRYFDLETERLTEITGGIPWDVDDLELSKNGDRLAFTVNEEGLGKLYLMETKTMNWKPVADLPPGQVGALRFHPDGKRLAMVLETARSADDVYVLGLPGMKLIRWTFSEVGGLNTASFAQPELIHFETFDTDCGEKRLVSAFCFKPSAEGPHPVVISIHGGPEAQYRPGFSPISQYMINELGIAVLAPNVRGSAGYGKDFLLLDNGFKREDSVKDIGALLDWIGKQPDLDAGRVAVMGGSYGGYMVLASMIRFNDRLKAGVDMVGISNFVTFLENTKDYRRDLRRVEYGDERDPEMRSFLEQISPTNSAQKITKPMLVVQGLNDPRVPAGEAEQIVAAIRKNGGRAWYLLAKDEGHGFRKKSNRDFYSRAVVMFLEENLLEK